MQKYIYLASKAQNRNFTHPIFESDFDCLTGNDRFQALLSHSPLASYNLKQKILKKVLFCYSNAFIIPKSTHVCVFYINVRGKWGKGELRLEIGRFRQVLGSR